MSQYLEHDKLHAIKDLSQACGEFLDWLENEGIVLAKRHEHTDGCGHIPRRADAYPGIDENKLEQEKRQMLEELRK